jgi:hypothetical protein
MKDRWVRPYFFVVTASHGALDAMTDGGLGIAFFAPFDNTRYFFPFRPIKKNSRNLVHLSGSRGKAKNATIQLKTNAKTSEWERPRCPSVSWYRIPKGKPSTSASGKTGHSTDKIQKRAGMRPTATHFPSNAATNPCVTIVGIKQQFS